jgi:hypothetical protein
MAKHPVATGITGDGTDDIAAKSSWKSYVWSNFPAGLQGGAGGLSRPAGIWFED